MFAVGLSVVVGTAVATVRCMGVMVCCGPSEYQVMKVSMEHRWDDNWPGKHRNARRETAPMQFVHHKPHMDFPSIEPGPLR